MRYLKTFENNNSQYSVGDIVVCIDNEDYKNLQNGNPYEILKIHEVKRKNSNYIEYYVDVIDLKTREYTSSTYSHRFIPKLEYDMKKYNL